MSLQAAWYTSAWSQSNTTLTSKLAFRIDSVFREVYYKKYKSLKIGSGNDVGEQGGKIHSQIHFEFLVCGDASLPQLQREDKPNSLKD